MSKSIRSARSREPQPVIICVRCGHLESQHGTSGLRPCLAMVGDLLHREFCKCDGFRAAVNRAA